MCVTNEILEEYAEVIERMTDHEFAELAIDVIVNNPHTLVYYALFPF